MGIKIELHRNKDCVVCEVTMDTNNNTRPLLIKSCQSYDGQTGSPNTNSPKFKILIREIQYHCPIGILDLSIFSHYENSLNREKANIRFRR